MFSDDFKVVNFEDSSSIETSRLSDAGLGDVAILSQLATTTGHVYVPLKVPQDVCAVKLNIAFLCWLTDEPEVPEKLTKGPAVLQLNG
jgi:hypothetical protein